MDLFVVHLFFFLPSISPLSLSQPLIVVTTFLTEHIAMHSRTTEGDDLRSENPRKAIEMFEKVVSLETAQGDQVKWYVPTFLPSHRLSQEYAHARAHAHLHSHKDHCSRRFKALQHLVVIYFGLGMFDKMVERYRAMLEYIGAVSRNECTEAINTILDTITSATNIPVLSQMYEITLIALKTANNERLWFNTNVKLAKLYLEDKKVADVERIVKDLRRTCLTSEGEDDPDKGSLLLEVYCLEIQLCALTGDADRMRTIYPRTLNLNAAVSDPRIMGIIREEGGKMQMTEGNWMEAYNEFYEAFRNYQEAGNSRARDCLKYVVLASMLSLNDINPFAAREAKAFADDPEILGMSDLRMSLEANDLQRFEKTVRNKRNRIQDEPFLMTYLEPLRRRMREQVLVNLVKPYRRVSLAFLAEELALSVDQVEGLVLDLIREGKLMGLVDVVQGILTLQPAEGNESTRIQNALEFWTSNLLAVQEDLIQTATFVQ